MFYFLHIRNYEIKNHLILGLFSVLLISCSEKFVTVDPTEFNNSIATKTDIKTAVELIELFYGYPENEGIHEFTVDTKELKSDKIHVTLVHDKLKDDSLRALKIVMIVKQNGQSWTVLEIKKNWKCWEGRGHTTWGREFCN